MPLALVVADANWVVDDVRAALTFGDWDIESLSDPRRAAEVVKETKPNVVIVDLQVHSMGGMAIIRAIRAVHQDEPPPRTVLLLDRSADRFIARRALADDSVVKPFVASELRAAVAPPVSLKAGSNSTEEE
jgi:DNA-binding response OmpR family regulator